MLPRRLLAGVVVAAGSLVVAALPGEALACHRRPVEHSPPAPATMCPGQLWEKGTGMTRRPVRLVLNDHDDLARIDTGDPTGVHSRLGHCTPWPAGRLHQEPTVIRVGRPPDRTR